MMKKGKLFCHHVWSRHPMTTEEMVKWRRTDKCVCIRCGAEKAAGLHLPPGPLDEDKINEIIKKYKGR